MADHKMDVLPHLVYELWMFRRLGDFLQRHPDPDVTNPGHSVEHNAILEAFLIHARVLLEFLFNARKNSYAKAREYPSGPYRVPEKTISILDLQKRVNDEAAHLTRGRIRVEKLSWDVEALSRDLSAAFAAFLRQVPEPYLSRLRNLLLEHQIAPESLDSGTMPASGILKPPPFNADGLRTHGP